jgi:hypothetical protein
MRRYIKAPYIFRLTRKPVPCSVIAPREIATALIRLASAAPGSESMRFEAKGALRRSGYAGKIQIGVILWIGNDLCMISRLLSNSRFISY